MVAPAVDPTSTAPTEAASVPTMQELSWTAGQAASKGKSQEVVDLLANTYGVRRMPEVPEHLRMNLLVHLKGLAGIET